MKLGDWNFRAFHDGRFKLDGGAMFGVVPKVFWEKHHPADEHNRIDLDLRCLLAEHGDRRILVDTGIGDRWDEKKAEIFAIERRPNQLVAELAEAGMTRESITDVVLTHLHFDHAGGTLREGTAAWSPSSPRRGTGCRSGTGNGPAIPRNGTGPASGPRISPPWQDDGQPAAGRRRPGDHARGAGHAHQRPHSRPADGGVPHRRRACWSSAPT